MRYSQGNQSTWKSPIFRDQAFDPTRQPDIWHRKDEGLTPSCSGWKPAPVSLAILVFVKFPVPGKVKTRLAATLGVDAASSIYRRMAEHVCSLLPEWATPVLLFDPPERQIDIENWLRPQLPQKAIFEPQASGDLGRRLREAFDGAFKAYSQVAAIGTDCVDLDVAIFDECLTALRTTDCVIGPASDGGFYLIALSRRCPGLFDGVPWSSSETFSKTMENACAAGFSVHLLPELHDIDTETDWKRVEAKLA